MEIGIRPTTGDDYRYTENLTREAFWNIYKPGCNEHLVLHNLRKSNSYISGLDLVATIENQIVGHIISTRATIMDPQNKGHEVLCAGPVSVLPDFQRKGIGSMLIRHSISAAKELGFTGMILFGNPEYYHRFGFRNAQEYGISTKEGLNFEPFMALELIGKGFENVKGRFIEDAAFDVLPDELIEFEKNFPYKEKVVTDTQLKH